MDLNTDSFKLFKTATVGSGASQKTLRFYSGTFNNQGVTYAIDENNSPVSGQNVGKAYTSAHSCLATV